MEIKFSTDRILNNIIETESLARKKVTQKSGHQANHYFPNEKVRQEKN